MNLHNNLTEAPADRQRLLQVRVGIASESDSSILKYSQHVLTTDVKMSFSINIELYSDYLHDISNFCCPMHNLMPWYNEASEPKSGAEVFVF